MPGVDSIDIDMEQQKVTVMGWADQEELLKAAKKTGRMAELWPFPYNADYADYYAEYYGSPTSNLYTDNSRLYSPDRYFVDQTESMNYINGYDRDNDYKRGFYKRKPYPVTFTEKATTMFSDDNATGCSIM